jgi:hypothetical protein
LGDAFIRLRRFFSSPNNANGQIISVTTLNIIPHLRIYVVIMSHGNRAAATVMRHPDGTPLTKNEVNAIHFKLVQIHIFKMMSS